MPQKRATLRDVAQATGYTIKTVSRAMQPGAAVAPETRAIICQKARELGYYPNRAASQLRSRQSRLVACIVGHLVNPYFGRIVEYVRTELEALGYTLLLFPTNETAEEEERAIHSALSFDVAGILFIPYEQSAPSVELLKRHAIPLVLICRELPDVEVDRVLCDEEAAGYLAACHLLEHGHRRLVYVGHRSGIYSIEQRLRGFLRAAREQGAEDCQVLGSLPRESRQTAMQITRRVIDLNGEGYTGVAAFCDMQGRYLLGLLHELGFDSVRRLGLMSFDNMDAVTPTGLPLCSVSSDFRGICRTAVHLLHSRITGDEAPCVRQLFPCEVVCRNSCIYQKKA